MGRVEAGYREASPPAGRGGNRSSGCAHHVNSNYGVAAPVMKYIFGKAVDSNCTVHLCRLLGRGARSQVAFAKSVGMQAAAVNLDPQDFLESDIGQFHLAAEVIEQRELTGFVGRLEGDGAKAEGLREAIGEGAIELARGVKQAH